MIAATIYKGIEYVRVAELPEEQLEAIKNWLNPETVIKIQTENALLSDCLQYKDYQFWFEKIFTKAISEAEAISTKTAIATKSIGLAFDR